MQPTAPAPSLALRLMPDVKRQLDHSMKTYKSWSADNLYFIAGILFNRRLYCCRADQLSDIREGNLRVENDGGRELQDEP